MKQNYIKFADSSEKEEQRTFEDLKYKIFMTYFQILETKTLSVNKGILLIVILNLQMISMTANDKNTDLNNSFISSQQGFLPVSNYFLLYPVLLSQNNILFNMLFLIITFLILLFLIVVPLYLAFQTNFDNPIIKQLNSLWGFISELADKILLVPVFGLTVGNVSCNYSNNQTECYGTINVILIILSLFCSIMLFILEILFSYLFFNFTFKIKDSMSRNPSGMPIFFFLYRLGITVFQSAFDLNIQFTYTVLVLLHLIFGLILMYDSLNNFPYHNKNVSKAQGIFASAYLWINATFILLQLTSIDMLHENVLVIVGLGMAFFLKLFLNIRNYFVKVLMNSELEEIQSAVLLDLKLRNYNNLAKTLDIKKSELLLASLLKIHSDDCVNTTCPCKRRHLLIDPKKKIVINDRIIKSKELKFKQVKQEQTAQLHRDQVFVKHFIARMAKDGLNKFKDSKLLYLDYMYYRFEALRLYSSIYFEVSKFEARYHNDMSLSIEFCLYRLRARLRKYLVGRNQKNEITRRLMLENVKAFDIGIIKQKENIVKVNTNLNELWESLSEEKPDLSKLLEIGNEAIKNMQVTQDQYEKLLLLNNQSQDLRNLMTIYATYLAYDDLLTKKIEKDIEQSQDMENDNSFQQDLQQLIKKYQIFDKQSCVLSISPQIETIGNITWCSRNVYEVFGYKESQLLSMNVNQLMPKPIASNHNRILKNFYENGRELYTTKMTHVWIIDSSNICFSANIFVKILPQLDSYDIVGFIHKLNQDDYIVCDVDGMIFGLGRKVCELFSIEADILLENRVNIQVLAPTIIPLFMDYFTTFESTNQLKGGDVRQQIDEYNRTEMFKDLKYWFLIAQDVEKIIMSFVDFRAKLFKKYDYDLMTKEPLKNDLMANDKYVKYIKANAEFKGQYNNLFTFLNKKIQILKLSKMIKVKLQVKNFIFWNGFKLQKLKILKITNSDVKDEKYIRENRRKVKEIQKKVVEFQSKVKQLVEDFKIKKTKQKQQEDQENADDIEEKVKRDEQGEENLEGNQLKGFQNVFKKAGKAVGRQSLFFKMNRLGKGKQDQDENQIKQGIFMTLFKNKLNKKTTKYKRNTRQQNSVAQVMQNEEEQDEEINTRKRIEVTNEQLEAIKKCAAVPKILTALYKAEVIGKAEWSVFYELKGKYVKADEFETRYKKSKKIKDLVNSQNFQRYKEQVLFQADSHSSNSEKNEYENFSDQFDDDQQEERSLIRRVRLNQGQNLEEKAALQSVSSSTQNLQASNAQRMLREQLKNMQAPTILLIAHYTMVFLSLLLFSLIVSQYALAKRDFEGIMNEVRMYQRLTNYSDNIIELLDSYFCLQQVNEGPLNSSLYSAEWEMMFRSQLKYSEEQMVNFFLSDFKQAGETSESGHDLRAYLFVNMQVFLLVNGQKEVFQINYENYVRLLLNAVNATIGTNLSAFSQNSQQDYFYYIFNNLEPFLSITDQNYDLITSYLNQSTEQLVSRFLGFWIACFGILFLLYVLIYPIILKTKLKIQETLRIFTKISLSDVEFYSSHYKSIFYLFKSIQDSPTLLEKIEEETQKSLDEKAKKDKENAAKNIARNRSHKGIQINKIVFFVAMTIWLVLFAGLVFVKDFFIINFTNEIDALFESQELQHKLKYIFQKNFLIFRQQYYLRSVGQLNQTQFSSFMKEVEDFPTAQMFQDNYQQLEVYSSSFSFLLDNLYTNNSCLNAFDSNFPKASQSQCESLLDGVLMQAYQNFFIQLQLEMLNGLNQIKNDAPMAELRRYIQHRRFQEYIEAFYYVKWTNRLWSELGRESLFIAIENQLSFNELFVILLSLLISAFLFLVWGREYLNLKRNSRWVNGFILLIPSKLRSENKHINSYLKNQLKIQGLMYL